MSEPRILVVGAGATGGYFGARLAQAGRAVTFLLRPGRAAAVRSDGLRLHTPGGESTLLFPQVVTAEEIAAPYDLILLATRADAVAEVAEQIAPAVGPETRILPVLNGVGHVDVLASRFGREAVLGGVALIASVLEDGAVRQLGPAASIAFGTLDGTRRPDLVALLEVPGISPRESDDILSEMWTKWVLIVSTTAVTTVLGAPVGEAVAVPGGLQVANAIVNEAAAVSAAAGHELAAQSLGMVRGAAANPDSPIGTTSVFRDMQAGRPVEVEPMLGAFQAEARRLGVPTPSLDVATARLRVYQARQGA